MYLVIRDEAAYYYGNNRRDKYAIRNFINRTHQSISNNKARGGIGL
jgi:hypothetical protein